MSAKTLCMACLLLVGMLVWTAAGTHAQIPDHPMSQLAEITAPDVYVRCGPSQNHYPVSKLQAGNRVTVVSENDQWYEILPTPDTFSWISEVYVDTVDNRNGVVNGDNVRVRAGSALETWEKHRSHPQLMLSKGAEIDIVGSSPDGWLKIKPPKGVTF
ncbi:MAG: SH3 domain-containing protein, partial [Planctomycetota bacterium]